MAGAAVLTAMRPLLLVAVLAAGTGACSRAAFPRGPDGVPTSPARVELVPGERVALSRGATLRYAALVSDSRCPVDAKCIHAGEAVLRFELDAAGRTRVFELSTAAPLDAATAGAYRIGLIDVSRRPPHRALVSVSPSE